MVTNSDKLVTKNLFSFRRRRITKNFPVISVIYDLSPKKKPLIFQEHFSFYKPFA